MKQLILKELREQFKVALIALVALSAMLALAFIAYGNQLQQAARYMNQVNADTLQPLMQNALLVQVSFFCAIFGALLGWLQIRAEKHPDLWAFLVHRPITRTTILRSKVVAGSFLYLASAGLPLLGLMIVVSIPGQVAAPFEWAMALPMISIVLSGLVFYFAGFLTGLRKARWYVSRGFGLGLAVLASFALFVVPEFWHALLIIVVAGTVLALAVWGSFQTGGYYREQPIAGKVALTLASTVSVLVLIGFVITFLINLLASHDGYNYSHYQLTKDGRVIKITQRSYDDADIVDLNGQPVLDEKTGQKIKPKDMGMRYATGIGAYIDLDNRSRKHNQSRESFFRTARFFSPWRVQDKTIWYLTADGRLVAYHALTRRFTGTLLPQESSVVGETADDSRFLRPRNYFYNQVSAYVQADLLVTAKTAYLVDLEKRELKPLLTVTNGDAIGGYAEGLSPFAPAGIHYALLLTRNSIQLLDFEGKTKLLRPYAPPCLEFPTVNVLWLEATNTFAVRFEPDYYANKEAGGKLLGHIDWVDADGGIRNAMDLPKLPEPQRTGVEEKLAIPLMPLAFPLWTWEEQYRIWNLLRVVPAIFCVILGWRLGRRNHFTLKARVGWGMFHLLFGLPGLLAFLAVQEWPAKESCPNCKTLRAVDREQCEFCGAAFAPPERTGTEIFEPLTTS